ncbi:MAG TPA: hypothetical protein VF280_15645 [Burkholderiales bacterium]|jgi:hypothetical protein
MKLGLFLALFAAGALAQDKPALRIVVDGVVKEAAACGLGVPAIEAVATRTLKSHNIAVSKNPADPYLYLNVNAYRVMQGADVVGCTTRIGVSVRGAAGEGTVRGFKPKADAYVVVCEAGRLLSGAQRDIVAAVTRAFEQDIKSCLSQLSY